MRKTCLITKKQNAEAFNSYFNNAVKPPNLQCDREHLNSVSDENDLIEIAIKKIENHPNIVNIDKNIPRITTFNSTQVETD